MPRSVNSVAKRARRKKIMKQAKGFFGRRKNVWTVAKNAVEKAMLYAYRDRKQNKRDVSADNIRIFIPQFFFSKFGNNCPFLCAGISVIFIFEIDKFTVLCK